MTEIRVLRVMPGGAASQEVITEEVLDGLYRLIGCSGVDRVALTERIDLWLDDEAFGVEPMNPAATYIAQRFGMTYQPYFGVAVFAGLSEDGADTVSLTDETCDALLAMLAEWRTL